MGIITPKQSKSTTSNGEDKKMTDKKIMVNDVNVSGCEHLTEIRGCWLSTCDYLKHKGNITSKVCKYNPECYFKQLARKTQECEQLKEKYEALKLENQEGYEIVDELKHEYEELENKIKKLRKNLALEIEASDRYRKALEEIEGIAKNFGSYAAWQEQRINKILDIINKAKGEEDER